RSYKTKQMSLYFSFGLLYTQKAPGILHQGEVCWLLGTSVRKIYSFLRTDVPSSQHRRRSAGVDRTRSSSLICPTTVSIILLFPTPVGPYVSTEANPAGSRTACTILRCVCSSRRWVMVACRIRAFFSSMEI